MLVDIELAWCENYVQTGNAAMQRLHKAQVLLGFCAFQRVFMLRRNILLPGAVFSHKDCTIRAGLFNTSRQGWPAKAQVTRRQQYRRAGFAALMRCG